MKAPFLVATVLTIVACAAEGQKRSGLEERETIRRTLDFSSGSARKVVEIDNVKGSIRVTGYNGSSVEMIANKTIRASSQDRLDTAKQDVKLDIKENAGTINIYVDQPGHEHSTNFSSRSHWANHGYEVGFDFELRVPSEAAVHLWTVNDGEISVQNIAGDFDVHNINGGIEMSGLSGSGEAKTINGPVKIEFKGNPTTDSSFSSLNGDIQVTFRPDLAADLRYKTVNGGVYTDFQINTLPASPGTPEKRNGKFVYKNDGFSRARVGKGGPEIEFDAFNGNVRIVRGK